LTIYRVAYIAITLAIVITDYRKDGDLFRAAYFFVLIAVGMEAFHWVLQLRSWARVRMNEWRKSRTRQAKQ